MRACILADPCLHLYWMREDSVCMVIRLIMIFFLIIWLLNCYPMAFTIRFLLVPWQSWNFIRWFPFSVTLNTFSLLHISCTLTTYPLWSSLICLTFDLSFVSEKQSSDKLLLTFYRLVSVVLTPVCMNLIGQERRGQGLLTNQILEKGAVFMYFMNYYIVYFS